MPARKLRNCVRSAASVAALPKGAWNAKAVRVAQRRELSPGGDEGALQGVLGKVAVAQDSTGQRVQAVAGRVDQGRECIAIATSRPLDEISHRLSLRDDVG
jgi:hypothetical protein